MKELEDKKSITLEKIQELKSKEQTLKNEFRDLEEKYLENTQDLEKNCD
jgi:hypothetical protein